MVFTLHIALHLLLSGAVAASPGLRISEISPASSPEWLEIANISDDTVHLGEFVVVDMDDGDTLTFPDRALAPGEYCALSSDSAALRAQHPFVPIRGALHWSTLRNSGAALCIVSAAGIAVDTAVYPSGATAQTSLVRIDPARPGGDASAWLLCSDPTPGQPDTRTAWRNVEQPRLVLDKKLFTPNGDGIDNRFPLRVFLPPEWTAAATIFGLDGNEIYSFGDVNTELLYWDGRDNTGRPAPRGPFVVLLRLSHGTEKKLLRGTGVLWRP